MKEKNSANADKLGIVEKYATEMAETKTVDECVEKIYKKKVVVKRASNTSAYQKIATTIISENATEAPDLGISLIQPISGTITSRFGVRARDNHPGLDIAAPKGTAIKAAAAGTVIFSGSGSPYSGYGNVVVVQCTDSVRILYGHCSAVYVQSGEYVAQGQVIAAVGSTGISTGNHLHFEIRKNGSVVNPQNYIYN